MTYRCTIFLAGMIALSGAATHPALARMYYVTYTGTASGIDTNGVFGVAGANLSNVAFTSTYTYDPSQFGNAVQNNSSVEGYVSGGSKYGSADPLLSASLTINGATYYQVSSFYGEQYSQNSVNAQNNSYIESDADSSASDALINYGYVTGPFTASLTALQSFSVSSSWGGFHYNGEQITLIATQVTETDGPSPFDVPEPPSLALLTGAAAVFAAALCSRRTASRWRKGMGSKASRAAFRAFHEWADATCTNMRHS